MIFKEGDLTVNTDTLSQQDFFPKLVETKGLDRSLQGKCEKYAKETHSSFITALIELEVIPPLELWDFIETHIKEDLFPFFDSTEEEYSFYSNKDSDEKETLLQISSLELILQGTRQMENHELIESFLPSKAERIFLLTPEYVDKIALNSIEKYLMRVVEKYKTLTGIVSHSSLGSKETKKGIYLFQSLGIIRTSSSPLEQILADISEESLHKALEDFNAKGSFIFKYISKEIGPAVVHILEKCIQQAQINLPPLFKELVFDSEGRIEPNSAFKISLKEKKIQWEFLKGLNEILAAEILTVKKVLGNAHESTLVKNLQKIGKWN